MKMVKNGMTLIIGTCMILGLAGVSAETISAESVEIAEDAIEVLEGLGISYVFTDEMEAAGLHVGSSAYSRMNELSLCG